jgi:oxygen-dependent protoporphyrinogen oxidase
LASPNRTIAVIGGGIAGLAAAHRLTEIDRDARVVLFESSDRLGGVMRTEERDGFLLEHSADMFVTHPTWAVDLCRQIGMADDLIPTDERFRRAFVVHRAKLYPVPEGFALMQPGRLRPMLATPLLSWRGKARLALEYFVPPHRVAKSPKLVSQQDTGPANKATAASQLADESLASFVQRRFGREVFERLVQPLVGGIYTADPEKLSLAATLPRFLEAEQEYGSLLRATWQQARGRARMKPESKKPDASGARYGMFVAPRRGMASLVSTLHQRLRNTHIHLNTPVDKLERTTDSQWRVVPAAVAVEARPFDAVIVAAGAHTAAQLLAPHNGALAAELRAIEYASSAIVCLGYRRSQIAHSLEGFGFVVPAIERRRILAASFASVKFPGRAPADRVLIRVFIGGALQPELLKRDDSELVRIAQDELQELLSIDGDPELATITRWTDVMPQYHLGHLDCVARIETAVQSLRGLEVAGSAFHGVGIPHCIHSGQLAAERAIVSQES